MVLAVYNNLRRMSIGAAAGNRTPDQLLVLDIECCMEPYQVHF